MKTLINRCTPAMAVVGIVTLVGSAIAQPPGGPRGDRGPRGGMGMMLANPAVQEELGLEEGQQEELRMIGEEIRDQMRSLFEGIRDLPREERRERMQDLREDMQDIQSEVDERVAEVLSSEQLTRLRQINLQMEMRRGGPQGMMSPKLIEQLDLSEDQQKQMREKAEVARKEMEEKVRQARSEALEEILSVLTSEQRAKYEELVGKQFEMPEQPRGERGRRGRGGPRGERGFGGPPEI